MKATFSIIVFLLQATACLGQVFTGVTAEYRFNRNTMSVEDAVCIAVDKAKDAAIEAVSNVEVSHYSILRTFNEENYYKSKITTSTGAVVRVCEKQVEVKRNKVRVAISGVVYPTKNRSVIDVWLREAEDDVTLRVSFNRDSYLRIFWFDNETNEGGLIYPLEKEVSKKFGANTTVKFPSNDEIGLVSLVCPWVMSKSEKWAYYRKYGKLPSSGYREEDLPEIRNQGRGTWSRHGYSGGCRNISLVFVTTENNVPVDRGINNEEMFYDWWTSLPLDDRDALVKKNITLRF